MNEELCFRIEVPDESQQSAKWDEPQPVAARREMTLAALGHDLYEDSDILPADVEAKYGKAVNRLIEGVTERAGVAEFVARVASAPEEARLVKLCDGIDNYGGLVENGLLRADPAKWVEIVRRQMEPMFSGIEAVPFRQYPVAGKWLSQELAKKREAFWVAGRIAFMCFCEGGATLAADGPRWKRSRGPRLASCEGRQTNFAVGMPKQCYLPQGDNGVPASEAFGRSLNGAVLPECTSNSLRCVAFAASTSSGYGRSVTSTKPML